MTDDQDQSGFRAPRTPQPSTPFAVKAAGKRLLRWAKAQEESGVVERDTPLLDRTPPDDSQLQRDFRLMQWYALLTDPGGG